MGLFLILVSHTKMFECQLLEDQISGLSFECFSLIHGYRLYPFFHLLSSHFAKGIVRGAGLSQTHYLLSRVSWNRNAKWSTVLWQEFDPWHGNLHIPQVWGKKRKRERKRGRKEGRKGGRKQASKQEKSSSYGPAETNQTSIHENVGSNPGLTQWVGDQVSPWAVV